MKKAMVLCIVLITAAPFIYGQGKKETEVAAATESLRKAMIDADAAALDRLTSGALSYGHSSGKVEGKSSFIENIVSGRSDFVTIDLSEQTITVTGHTAIVRHILSAATNDGGKPGNVRIAVILVWQKGKNNWLLLARQAVKLQ
ncbi:MAG: nuclear transport factor 2 family protein [Chitinophagaceae bacterium]|nr:nuclear transport factor 2 family protein [Chitinophagaceae bacterium]